MPQTHFTILIPADIRSKVYRLELNANIQAGSSGESKLGISLDEFNPIMPPNIQLDALVALLFGKDTLEYFKERNHHTTSAYTIDLSINSEKTLQQAIQLVKSLLILSLKHIDEESEDSEESEKSEGAKETEIINSVAHLLKGKILDDSGRCTDITITSALFGLYQALGGTKTLDNLAAQQPSHMGSIVGSSDMYAASSSTASSSTANTSKSGCCLIL